jgi:hypothetical protein
MEKHYFSLMLQTNQSPEKVFRSIQDIQGWWSENFQGNTNKINDEFEVRFADIHYSRQRVIDYVKDKKITWLVTDSQLNFTQQKNEWTGTEINFEISQKGPLTQIRFDHLGLVPAIECYNACSDAWSSYLKDSLLKLIDENKGQPWQKEIATKNII